MLAGIAVVIEHVARRLVDRMAVEAAGEHEGVVEVEMLDEIAAEHEAGEITAAGVEVLEVVVPEVAFAIELRFAEPDAALGETAGALIDHRTVRGAFRGLRVLREGHRCDSENREGQHEALY